MIYYLSLGSNLGDRQHRLHRAVSFLGSLGTVRKISSIYETSPVEMADDAENFLNQAVCLESSVPPRRLLSKIKAFESGEGRDIRDSHNKPRAIDIDILTADDLICADRDLTLPHRKMAGRAFVLIPLCEIAPQLIHPVLKKTIKEIAGCFKSTDKVKKLDHLS